MGLPVLHWSPTTRMVAGALAVGTASAVFLSIAYRAYHQFETRRRVRCIQNGTFPIHSTSTPNTFLNTKQQDNSDVPSDGFLSHHGHANSCDLPHGLDRGPRADAFSYNPNAQPFYFSTFSMLPPAMEEPEPTSLQDALLRASRFQPISNYEPRYREQEQDPTALTREEQEWLDEELDRIFEEDWLAEEEQYLT